MSRNRQVAAAAAGWMAMAVWCGVLWYASSLPPRPLPVSFPHVDKAIHFLYFMGGGAALAWAWAFTAMPRSRWFLAGCWIVMCLAGISDEWHQLFTPGRQGGDGFDFLADSVGAAVGVMIGYILYGRVRKLLS